MCFLCQKMSEDVRRRWSISAIRRGHTNIFRSAVFKKRKQSAKANVCAWSARRFSTINSYNYIWHLWIYVPFYKKINVFYLLYRAKTLGVIMESIYPDLIPYTNRIHIHTYDFLPVQYRAAYALNYNWAARSFLSGLTLYVC